ncbi:ATP-binding protein [Candidatus Gottesmanbacteria bacterium]|nr:ATP-binding protein [Candidatus Gottesmanbacteria bacterium]
MLQRAIEKQVQKYLSEDSYKIFFIWGPRRSGKTTILKDISRKLSVPIFNFDLLSDREGFVPRREMLEKIALTHKTILIDEVQNFPESTVALKILYDEFKVKIIATGSSELRQKSKDFDSLAGRFTDNYCLPLSIYEIAENTKVLLYEKQNFDKKLQNQLQIFGAYPEVYTHSVSSDSEKIELLQNIFDAYILKDVVNIYELKNEKLAKDILTKIALQIGSEVSLREIAGSLNANVVTVSNYIEIFIKNYIIIPLPSFKTNARKAVSENRKLYFYDLGIRNVLVKDFRELNLRPDKGGVFENFIISEIEKQRMIYRIHKTMYFYREYGGQEVDLVMEDYKKQYQTLEIKVNERKGNKDIFPLSHTFTTVNNKNYFEKIKEVVK